jgi:hypothetical protein
VVGWFLTQQETQVLRPKGRLSGSIFGCNSTTQIKAESRLITDLLHEVIADNIDFMRKICVTLLLVICIGWQSLASTGYGVLTASEEQEQHEQLHFQGIAHHHDKHAEDFHEDDSVSSLAHMICDASHCSPALLFSQCSQFELVTATRSVIEPQRARDWLLPNQLDRPPKQQA